MTMTRDDIARILADDWDNPLHISDLATTALSLMDERDAFGVNLRAVSGVIRDLQTECDTAEARCKALEEGLREAAEEAHAYGLLRVHPEGTSAGVDCPAVLCVDTRALITERDLEKGGAAE